MFQDDMCYAVLLPREWKSANTLPNFLYVVDGTIYVWELPFSKICCNLGTCSSLNYYMYTTSVYISHLKQTQKVFLKGFDTCLPKVSGVDAVCTCVCV